MPLFLSCLLGSEDVGLLERLDLAFLSCLLGSEGWRRPGGQPARFLSCLLGSEVSLTAHPRGATFLSCLLGSEEALPPRSRPPTFLSCLLGSEGVTQPLAHAQRFLSCLLGSEVTRTQTNILIVKEKNRFPANHPKSSRPLKPQENQGVWRPRRKRVKTRERWLCCSTRTGRRSLPRATPEPVHVR